MRKEQAVCFLRDYAILFESGAVELLMRNVKSEETAKYLMQMERWFNGNVSWISQVSGVKPVAQVDFTFSKGEKELQKELMRVFSLSYVCRQSCEEFFT
jgi:hypothetical protein